MKRIGMVIGLVGVLTVQALAQDRTDAQIMIQAARSLKVTQQGNMAFILEKRDRHCRGSRDLWLR